MENKSIKKFGNKMLVAGKYVVAALCGVLFVMVVTLVFLAKMAIYTIIYNPITFGLWATIHPKSAAASLNRDCEREVKTDFYDSLVDRVLFAPEEFFWWLNKKCRGMFPWRAQKELLAVRQLREASFKEELRFFNESDREELIKSGWLSSKLKSHAFGYIEAPLVTLLVKQMDNLSTEQFSQLVYTDNVEAIIYYLTKYTTLTEKKLKIWADAIVQNTNTSDRVKKLFLQYAELRGLPASVISHIHTKGYVTLVEAITPALELYEQKQFILQSTSLGDNWRRYCLQLKHEGKTIANKNQRLMKAWQYIEFKKAGFSLCEEAIVYWFSQDDRDMQEKIIHNEDRATSETPHIKNIIAADPKLAQMLLNKN